MRPLEIVVASALLAWLAGEPVRAADLAPAARSAQRSAPWSRNLLFRVDKPGVPPSYVFGTVHSGDPRVAAIASPVRDALAAARTVAMEIRLGEGDLAEFFEAAQFDDGRKIGDFFDPPTVAAIHVAPAEAVPDEGTLDRLKPWAILLKLAERPASAGDTGETLDQALLEAAIRRKLTVIGLELPEEQIAAFDAIPLPAQVALVRLVLAEREALTRNQDGIIAAWLDRDLARLAALAAEPGKLHPEIAPQFAELTRHVVDDRTVVMAHCDASIGARAGRAATAR